MFSPSWENQSFLQVSLLRKKRGKKNVCEHFRPIEPQRLSVLRRLHLAIVVVEVLLYVHRNRRLIRDGSPGRPPRLSHSSWALVFGHFDRLGDPRSGRACRMTVRMMSGAWRSRTFLSEALNFPSTSLSGHWANDETTWETSVWKLVGSIRLRFRDVTCCFALLGFLRESSQNTFLWSDSATHIMSGLSMTGKSSRTIITQSSAMTLIYRLCCVMLAPEVKIKATHTIIYPLPSLNE